MTGSKRDLFLITGIPGTGKTRFGDTLATDFGFRHYDLEEDQTSNRMFADPTGFIGDILRGNKDTVATWGFNPEHQPSVSLVLQFKNKAGHGAGNLFLFADVPDRSNEHYCYRKSRTC